MHIMPIAPRVESENYFPCCTRPGRNFRSSRERLDWQSIAQQFPQRFARSSGNYSQNSSELHLELSSQSAYLFSGLVTMRNQIEIRPKRKNESQTTRVSEVSTKNALGIPSPLRPRSGAPRSRPFQGNWAIITLRRPRNATTAARRAQAVDGSTDGQWPGRLPPSSLAAPLGCLPAASLGSKEPRECSCTLRPVAPLAAPSSRSTAPAAKAAHTTLLRGRFIQI